MTVFLVMRGSYALEVQLHRIMRGPLRVHVRNGRETYSRSKAWSVLQSGALFAELESWETGRQLVAVPERYMIGAFA